MSLAEDRWAALRPFGSYTPQPHGPQDPYQTTEAERRRALDLMLTEGGAGSIGANPVAQAETVNPVFAAGDANATRATDEAWRSRNQTVADAGANAVGQVGGALAMMQMQNQELAEQKYQDSLPTGRGGGIRPRGSGKGEDSGLFSPMEAHAGTSYEALVELLGGDSYSDPPSIPAAVSSPGGYRDRAAFEAAQKPPGYRDRAAFEAGQRRPRPPQAAPVRRS